MSAGLLGLAYPSDRHSSAKDLVQRYLCLLTGGFLLTPVAQEVPFFRRWFRRGSPARFRAFCRFLFWPFANLRRITASALCTGPACLLVKVSEDAVPTTQVLHTMPPPTVGSVVRVVAVSDTHGQHDLARVPPCDVLIHCGDVLIEDRGLAAEDGGSSAKRRIVAFGAWCGAQPCGRAVVTGGNHDAILEDLAPAEVCALLEEGRASCVGTSCVEVRFVKDESLYVAGLRMHVTPLSMPNSAHSQNRAFQPSFDAGPLEERIQRSAAALPAAALDVLVSHGPPRGALDDGQAASDLLADYVATAPPLVHVFGHQHLAYGVAVDLAQGTVFANASACDGYFGAFHPPIVLDISRRVLLGDRGARASATGGYQVVTGCPSSMWRSFSTLSMRRLPFAFDRQPPEQGPRPTPAGVVGAKSTHAERGA